MASVVRQSILAGRRALVTGSTSGIGLGIAKVLASQGASIMLNGFADTKAVTALQSEFKSLYGVQNGSKWRVAYHGADLKTTNGPAALIDETVKELGGIDIVINNAGIQYVSPIDQFPIDKWNDIIAINLTAPFITTRTALPHFRRNGWGRVVNIASVHGLVASKDKAPYVASKHGIVGFTKAVALETAGQGITINAVCPGWVLTPLVQQQIDARAKAKGLTNEQATVDLLAEKQPSKQFTTVEQLGQLTAYLCSDAAAQLTGTAIPVDGAWTAQ